MNCNKRVPEEVKKNILKQIYGDRLKKLHYILLDSLIPYRHIIKKQVMDIHKLFQFKRIDINNLSHGAVFEDVENPFFEGKTHYSLIKKD